MEKQPVEGVPPSLAIFTIESFASGGAVERLLDHFRDRVSIVVTSDRYGPERGSQVKQSWDMLHRCGVGFSVFLLYNFVLYSLVVNLNHLRHRLLGKTPPILGLARACEAYGLRHLHTSNVNGEFARQALEDAAADIFVVFYFDQILHEQTIALAPSGVINVHTGLLPEYRGLFPEVHAAARDSRFGVTVHRIVDKSIDSGPILLREEVTPIDQLSVLSISRCLHMRAVQMTTQIIDHYNELPRGLRQGPGHYFSLPLRGEAKAISRNGYRLTSLRQFVKGVSDANCGES